MNLPLAAGFATLISVAVFCLVAVWHVAPWLRAQSLAGALAPLLWVHAFRYVALQIFSAAHFGFAVSEGGREQIAYGDVAGAFLALAAITALRYRWRSAIFVTWVFAIESAVDLANATAIGVREQLLATANGLTWVIVNIYAPLLWVSLGLLIWQLYARRREHVAPANVSTFHPASVNRR